MRLIDADTLKEKWTIASPEPYSTDTAEVLDSIEAAPTISAVPVVRCQECKHKNTTACPAYDAPFMRTSLRIKFCSEGHRKEAAHD